MTLKDTTIYDFGRLHPYAAGSFIVVTQDSDGNVVAISRQNEEHQIKEILWQK